MADDTTWAQAAQQMIAVVSRLSALMGALSDWSVGPANGGPSGDGRYPFVQPDNTTILVPSPARIRSDAISDNSTALASAVASVTQLRGELGAWMAGTVTGGPGDDGRFPITSPDGSVTLVPSPAKLAALNADVATIVSNGSLILLVQDRIYATFAALNATSPAGSLWAMVHSDPNPLANGYYLRSGGAWSLKVPLPSAALLAQLSATQTAQASALAALGTIAPATARATSGFGQISAITFGGRLLQPTMLSFDLYVLAGVYLDTGEFYSAPLAAEITLIQSQLVSVIAKLSQITFLPPIDWQGRSLQPTKLSFDLQVMEGVWLDDGTPFTPLAPDTTLARQVTKSYVLVDPVVVQGRLFQPTTLSFDLYVLSGYFLDNGEPYGGGGGGGSGAVKIIPKSDTLAYVVTPRAAGGGFAYRFHRHLGGSSDLDTGPPYEPWRRTGVAVLANYEDDPDGAFTGTPPAGAFAYNLDVGLGATDYAFNRLLPVNGTPSFVWAGSYHGGEELLFYRGPDLTVPARLAEFKMHRTTRVTWADGVTYDTDYTVEIACDGTGAVCEGGHIMSTAAINQVIAGMEIGSVTPHSDPASGYSQVWADGSPHTVDYTVDQTLPLGTAREVVIRNPDTGAQIRCISSLPYSYLQGGKTYILTQAGNRTKIYFERGPGTLGNVSFSRTTVYEMEPAA